MREFVRSVSQARCSVVIVDDEADSDGESDHSESPEVPAPEAASLDCVGTEVANQLARRMRHNAQRGVEAPVMRCSLSTFLGAIAHATDLLSSWEGWLDKARPGWFDVWQRRWFVLCRKRLEWFSSPGEKVPLGVLDFDLVVCEVERLWIPSKESGIRPHSFKSKGYCTSCDPWAFLDSAMSRVCFRVCPVGSDRAFLLRAASEADGEAWVGALEKHIGHAEASSAQLPSQLDSLGRTHWWKVKRISQDKFVQIAQTGDILLFRSTGTAPMIIRAASGGRFDHVALILKLADGTLALFEATGNLGVGVCTWKEFLENDWNTLYPEIALRRVHFQRTPERLAALEAWCFEVNGKPYSLTMNKLRQRNSASSGGVASDDSFFCSELVAEALKVLGVLPRGLSSTQFWPASFEACQKLPVEMEHHARLGEELTIDFKLSPRAVQSSGVLAKQRDATTNW